MKEVYVKWHSPILKREASMLIFGESGYPLIILPALMGRYFQCKDRKLIKSVSWYLEQRLIKIYCPDSWDAESWCNSSLKPAEKVRGHVLYEEMLKEEVVKRAMKETGFDKVAMAGCCFGAYHATNFSFKNPYLVSCLINMGGAYDIKFLLGNYYDDFCYKNNPTDYISEISPGAFNELCIILGVGEKDFYMEQNIQLSGILKHKEINHFLDIRDGQGHDWSAWAEMFPSYIPMLPFPAPTATI